MKKLCFVLVLVFLSLASGCKNKNISDPKKTAPPSTYTANIDVSFKELKINGELTKHETNKYSIKILTPDIMKPLSITYENDICTVEYDGLEFESDVSRFPQSEFGALLTQALDDIDSETMTFSADENGDTVYKGITDYGDFRMIQDSKTGLWKEFYVDGASLKITFSDYKIN